MNTDVLARTLCFVAVFCAAYVVGIYPLLLGWLSRVRPQPILRQAYTPSVSVIIATHNGAAFLADKLRSVFALDYPRHLLQVIVVSDGSTDNTRAIVEQYEGDVLFIDAIRAGKAAALNHGMAAATGEIFVFTDVRQQLAGDSLRLLMENFADATVGVTSGELQISPEPSGASTGMGAYWKYERWIRLKLSTVDSIFGATGAYYAMRRELAVPLPANELVDDMFLPLHAFFKGYRLIVDARAKMYDYPADLAAEFSRKVRTLAGNYQILAYYPQLLGPKNRLLLHFLSYKLGRLFLPFALLLAAISSLAGGGAFADMSSLLQCAICLAITVDLWISAKNPLKRVTAPVTSYAVMMIASLLAISIWFLPPEHFWKPSRISRHSEAIP